MFVREKRINGYTYLYLVETVREDGRAKQRIIKNLGRKEAVVASGGLERLAASVARYAERTVVLSQLETGNPHHLACRRVGAPLLFGQLWERAGCRAVIEELLASRGFEFPVERAVFATVLHRIMASGSDRACEKWLADYDVPGADSLALHQLYRAMAWLGEELSADQQAGATPFAPRTVKDLVEERLFARRRDLFTELSVVFMDTTSLSFDGAGGKSLGERGYSKDHRPDLMQMILGVVVDAEGHPVCSEMWPGNTADVSVLLPVVDRLRGRFAIGRVCVVADRGMISAPTIAALEQRGLEYVLGARERTDTLVREVVLADSRPFTPLCIPRAGGEETQLWVKEVTTEGRLTHVMLSRRRGRVSRWPKTTFPRVVSKLGLTSDLSQCAHDPRVAGERGEASGLGAERVPGRAERVHDGLLAPVQAEGKVAFPQVQPDPFRRAQLGRVRRQRQKRDVGRHLQGLRAMPASLVEQERDVHVVGQGRGEAGEEQVHGFRRRLRQHQGEGVVGAGTDGGEDVGGEEALVAAPRRSLATGEPATAGASLLPLSGLVFTP